MSDTLNPLNWDIGNPEPNREQLEVAKQKAYEDDVDFLKCFSTASGKKVLEWMIKFTLDSPTWWPGRPAEFGYWREGQNNLVRQIKAKVNNAKDYQEKKK